MVTKDENTEDVDPLNMRWTSAAYALWRFDAIDALRIDRALSGDERKLLRIMLADRDFAKNVRSLAKLAWDELCSTPDPRIQPNQLEA